MNRRLPLKDYKINIVTIRTWGQKITRRYRQMRMGPKSRTLFGMFHLVCLG